MIKRKFLLPAFSPAAGAITSPGAWISSPRASWSLARIMSCANPTPKCLLKRNENFHSQENLYTYVYAPVPKLGTPNILQLVNGNQRGTSIQCTDNSTYSKRKKEPTAGVCSNRRRNLTCTLLSQTSQFQRAIWFHLFWKRQNGQKTDYWMPRATGEWKEGTDYKGGQGMFEGDLATLNVGCGGRFTTVCICCIQL